MSSAFTAGLAGLRHRVTTKDGLELEVREWGDPTGPALILVTGVAQSYLSFVQQYSAPELQGFRIVSFDPRGHGLSSKPLGAEWYQEGSRWSGDVRAIMDALNISRPVLAGWSMGGRIVRQYLVDHGDADLAGVVFISCRPVETPDVIGAGNNVVKSLSIDDLGSRIDVATAFLRNCFGKQPNQEDFAAALAFNMLCPFEIRLQIGGWQTEVAVSESALRAISVPTLIIHGLEDVLVLPGAARASARLVPHAQVSWYEHCGHSVFLEEPARFNAELAAFVSQTAQGATRAASSDQLAGAAS